MSLEFAYYSLADLVKIKYGKNQKKVQDDDNGKYPIFGTGGLMGFSKEYLYDKPSVLIGRKGSIEKVRYVDEPFWTVDTLFYSEINSCYMPKYIYYLFQTIPWKKYNTSTGVPSLTSTTIEGIEKSFPSLEEQHKIAEFLSLIDERIATQNKIIEDLKVVIDQISNKVFNLEIINNSFYTLKDFLIEGDKTPVQTDKYRKITVKLNKQGLIFSENNREMADTRPFYKRYENELIIGKQNYFNGSIALVSKEYDSCICSNAIMSFKINNINNDFLYYQISNNNYINSQSYKANGTGQKELSEKDFLKFKVWVPTQSEQDKIVKCLKSFELKLKTEISFLNNLMLMKKYLLNNLFV